MELDCAVSAIVAAKAFIMLLAISLDEVRSDPVQMEDNNALLKDCVTRAPEMSLLYK